MAYNSSGVFSRLFDWTDDRDNGIKIRADRFDQELDGFATGLTTTLLKDGTQTATAIIPFAVGLSILDNQSAIFGTNSDYTLQYDEATRDALILASNVEGAAFKLTLAADQGDDASDEWQVGISTGGVLSIGNDIASAQTYVSQLTLTPHATVASSTTAVLGNLTVGGSLSLGSAVIAEAELEMLDGITAGTVIASKAIVTDSDKDITGGRNITITGELDAATGDFSGDVDVDGTLEADAITVNGTALATVIAGTTVTNATNSAHVLVTDNESTNEENLIAFVEGATSSTGNVGLEMDGNLAYNPSTGTVSATVFKGNIDAVDGDFDGTLEADAITLNGTAITATATLDTGISNNNVPKFTTGVADDDFLRVNGTAIEGRSASEVLSDIGASAVAGSSSIVTTGALDTGSITSNFGTINNGASAITTTGAVGTGALTAGGLVTANANMLLGGTTPTLTIGDAGAEDAKIVFDGNAQDFHIGLDDTTDDLVIGLGSALGTTTAISIDENVLVTVADDVSVVGRAFSPTLTANLGSGIDLALGNNFLITTTGDVVLTFTNQIAGQSGTMKFVNDSDRAVTAHTNVAISEADLATISATGTYMVSYFVTASAAANTILVSASAILT